MACDSRLWSAHVARLPSNTQHLKVSMCSLVGLHVCLRLLRMHNSMMCRRGSCGHGQCWVMHPGPARLCCTARPGSCWALFFCTGQRSNHPSRSDATARLLCMAASLYSCMQHMLRRGHDGIQSRIAPDEWVDPVGPRAHSIAQGRPVVGAFM